jgi:hypothetical protein
MTLQYIMWCVLIKNKYFTFITIFILICALYSIHNNLGILY